MTNKTILYTGSAVLSVSLLAFIGSLIYVFATVFTEQNAAIGAISLSSVFLPLFGVIIGIILTVIGFFLSRKQKDLP